MLSRRAHSDQLLSVQMHTRQQEGPWLVTISAAVLINRLKSAFLVVVFLSSHSEGV